MRAYSRGVTHVSRGFIARLRFLLVRGRETACGVRRPKQLSARVADAGAFMNVGRAFCRPTCHDCLVEVDRALAWYAERVPVGPKSGHGGNLGP